MVLLLTVVVGSGQSRIIKPTQPNSNANSGKRQHTATLRSSDSTEGSRVAITSDQSLNDYEAYRRGDHFYVKIPAADVPRAEAVRGRGFVDVKAQKTGDGTILSFRLQPGATAHVEQRANKLDVVVSVPGGGTPAVSSNRTREPIPNLTSGIRGADTNRRTTPTINSNKQAAKNSSNSNSKSSAAPSNSNKTALNSGSANKSTSTLKLSPTPVATPTPIASPSAKPSPTSKPSTTPLKSLTAASSPVPTPPNAGAQTQADWWSRLKERAHYAILLAQLNPVPVGLGAGLLLLIIGLLLFQRRRARATRRARTAKSTGTTVPVSEAATTSSVTPVPAATVANESAVETQVAAEKVVQAPAVAPIVVPAAVPETTTATTPDEGRKERLSRGSEEAKKLFSGESYDAAVIGSEDRETRRIVGAELASALVGRSPERRERAREAFMKHGYFDDATRDLRTADSENERAAAARRLSFVQDREATPHLIGALADSSPDVRRAAVEALMDLRDPAAIQPLNSLLQTESDRKVPRNLISQAIEACATTTSEPSAPSVPEPAPSAAPESMKSVPQPAPPSYETEREVIEL